MIPVPGARRSWPWPIRSRAGLWTVEARLLYDLQKACIDQERADVHGGRDALDSVVRAAARSAATCPTSGRWRCRGTSVAPSGGSPACGFPTASGGSLREVLGAVTQAAENRLREDLRPRIAATLDEIDLRPKNMPEEVSRRKIVEELLDRIVERGFLRWAKSAMPSPEIISRSPIAPVRGAFFAAKQPCGRTAA